jgi:hypothetical protein
MTLLLSLPSGLKWIILLTVLIWVIVFPILAIYFYIKNRELNKQIITLTKALSGK